jgi:16S rRNA (uracil1498-N3)-methyltransferase
MSTAQSRAPEHRAASYLFNTLKNAVAMTRHRAYCPDLDPNQKKITISNKNEAHHLSHVLRAKEGDQISIFNGHGLEGIGAIISVRKDRIELEVLSLKKEQQPQPLIAIACAIPKRSKFETIIEKCTELGADEIIPLKTLRTEIDHATKNSDKKHKRYQEIAVNAAKQSGCSFLPNIHPQTTFEIALDEITSKDLALIGCIKGQAKKIHELDWVDIKKKKRIIVFIGPEGDFTDTEVDKALQKGCLPITLGPNILKVETAAISAMAHLMLHLRS